jgi:predicted nucleotidyltransferase
MTSANIGIGAAEMDRLTHQLVQRFHAEKVILFGSYAYGQPHEDSDLDLLVVAPNPPSLKASAAIAYELGRHLPLRLQLVFMSPVEYEESKHVVGGLAYPAHRWGKVLHDTQPGPGRLGLRAELASEGRG